MDADERRKDRKITGRKMKKSSAAVIVSKSVRLDHVGAFAGDLFVLAVGMARLAVFGEAQLFQPLVAQVGLRGSLTPDDPGRGRARDDAPHRLAGLGVGG